MIAAPITHAPSTEPNGRRASPGEARGSSKSGAAAAKDTTAPAADEGPDSFTAALADAEQQVHAGTDRESGGPRTDGSAPRTPTRRDHKDPRHASDRGATATQVGAVMTPAGHPPDAKPRVPEATGDGSAQRAGSDPHRRATSGAKSRSDVTGAVVASSADAANVFAGATAPSTAHPTTSQTTAPVRASNPRPPQHSGDASTPAVDSRTAQSPTPEGSATAAAASGATAPVAMAAGPLPASTEPDTGLPAGPSTSGATPPGAARIAQRSTGPGATDSSTPRPANARATPIAPVTDAARGRAGTAAFKLHANLGVSTTDADHASGQPASSGNAAAGASASGSSGLTANAAAAPAAAAAAIAAASSPPPAAVVMNVISASPVAMPTATAAASSTSPATASSVPLPTPTLELATHLVGQPGWAQAVAQAIVTHAGAAGGRLRLQVQPPNLGPIDITLSIHNTSATLQLIAQHPFTQAALQQSIPQLHALLGQQGVQLMHADVTAGQSGGQGQGRGHDAPPTPARVGTPTPVTRASASTPARTRAGLVDDYA